MTAKSTKKSASKTVVSPKSRNASAGLGKADPVPSTLAPTPPTDYTPAVLRSPARPPLGVVQSAPAVVTELRSKPSYASDLGARAPDPGPLATSIAFALAWTDQLLHAEAWYTYVKEQTQLAWQQSTKGVDALTRTFTFAAEGDPTIATTYPGIAKFIDARKLPSKLGAATKKERRKATKEKADGTPPPPSPPLTQAAATKDTVH
jgi:hypothetical protein